MGDGGGEHRAPAENAGAAAETNICLANTINLYGGEGTLPDRLRVDKLMANKRWSN